MIAIGLEMKMIGKVSVDFFFMGNIDKRITLAYPWEGKMHGYHIFLYKEGKKRPKAKLHTQNNDQIKGSL